MVTIQRGHGVGGGRRFDRLAFAFDDGRVVANAGLVLASTLVGRLGIEQVIDDTLDLGERPGAARPGRKLLTLFCSAFVGGESIDDANVLRCGETERVLGHRVMAPSTLGTVLRSFTFGHVRQLDRVFMAILGRAWAAGAGPDAEPLTIGLDSTIVEVDGRQKQGAGYGYTKRRGYHPLLATRADTGEVLHARMRKGRLEPARRRTLRLRTGGPGAPTGATTPSSPTNPGRSRRSKSLVRGRRARCATLLPGRTTTAIGSSLPSHGGEPSSLDHSQA